MKISAQNKTTKDEALQRLRDKGLSISKFARAHNLPYRTVLDLLKGRIAGHYGESHRAAVLLGMKASEAPPECPAQQLSDPLPPELITWPQKLTVATAALLDLGNRDVMVLGVDTSGDKTIITITPGPFTDYINGLPMWRGKGTGSDGGDEVGYVYPWMGCLLRWVELESAVDRQGEAA